MELQDELDRKLIIEDDLKEAIWLAKQTGERFLSDDGVIQCSMVKSVLTYWVQYKELKTGEYEIRSAYIHRMKFNRRVNALDANRTWKCAKCDKELVLKKMLFSYLGHTFSHESCGAPNAETALFQRNWQKAAWQRWRRNWKINRVHPKTRVFR